MLRKSWFRTTVFALFCLMSSGQAKAQNYSWSSTSGGSWTNGLNWGSTSGDYPDSAFTRATFSASVNGSPITVTLDSSITLRRLVFNANQSGAVTIAPGTGGTLTFDNPETGQPSLNVQAGSGNHTIVADVAIQGPISHKWNIGANQTFTISGNISGTQGLTSLGTGTLLLNGTNTYAGATTVSFGTLGGSGSIASAVTMAAGTTLTAGTAAAAPKLTLNNGVSIGGRYLVTLFANDAISRLDVTGGSALIGGGSMELALGAGVTVNSFRLGGPQSYTILDAGNGMLNGTFSTTNFTTAGFAASEWSIAYDNTNGNVILNFTPVPEPITALLLASGVLLSVRLIRRRMKRLTSPVVA